MAEFVAMGMFCGYGNSTQYIFMMGAQVLVLILTVFIFEFITKAFS